MKILSELKLDEVNVLGVCKIVLYENEGERFLDINFKNEYSDIEALSYDISCYDEENNELDVISGSFKKPLAKDEISEVLTIKVNESTVKGNILVKNVISSDLSSYSINNKFEFATYDEISKFVKAAIGSGSVTRNNAPTINKTVNSTSLNKSANANVERPKTVSQQVKPIKPVNNVERPKTVSQQVKPIKPVNKVESKPDYEKEERIIKKEKPENVKKPFRMNILIMNAVIDIIAIAHDLICFFFGYVLVVTFVIWPVTIVLTVILNILFIVLNHKKADDAVLNPKRETIMSVISFMFAFILSGFIPFAIDHGYFNISQIPAVIIFAAIPTIINVIAGAMLLKSDAEEDKKNDKLYYMMTIALSVFLILLYAGCMIEV